MNSVQLIGRLTRDPEIRHTASGVTVASFALAVDRAGDRDDDGGYAAGFFDVECFGKQAELVEQWVSKGRQVGIEGRLKHHKWEANDGTKRSRVEVIASRVTFTGSSREDGRSNGDDQQQIEPPGGDGSDDDIPF